MAVLNPPPTSSITLVQRSMVRPLGSEPDTGAAPVLNSPDGPSSWRRDQM